MQVGGIWLNVILSYRKQNVCMQSIPLAVAATQQIHRADFHVISSCIYLFSYFFICVSVYSFVNSLIRPPTYYYYYYYYYYYFRYHLCGLFTIIYLKQIMSVGYTVLQLLCAYNLCYM